MAYRRSGRRGGRRFSRGRRRSYRTGRSTRNRPLKVGFRM